MPNTAQKIAPNIRKVTSSFSTNQILVRHNPHSGRLSLFVCPHKWLCISCLHQNLSPTFQTQVLSELREGGQGRGPFLVRTLACCPFLAAVNFRHDQGRDTRSTVQAQCGRAAGNSGQASETWFDNGELSEQEKAIIRARLDEYDRNPEVDSSWEEAKARILAGLTSMPWFWPDRVGY
jgi:hypothetical protein